LPAFACGVLPVLMRVPTNSSVDPLASSWRQTKK
jgi:hypothetical protein